MILRWGTNQPRFGLVKVDAILGFLGLIQMGEKLKVKKSKEKSETMNGYGRLIELPI